MRENGGPASSGGHKGSATSPPHPHAPPLRTGARVFGRRCLSVTQTGRPKGFMGTHAQLFKGVFKSVGPRALAALAPWVDAAVADADAHSKLPTDVYVGQQCLLAEVRTNAT
jgi:hypothetical protein